MTTELKPCPFDDGAPGHKVRLVKKQGRAGTVCPSRWWREHVECKCGARGPEFKSPGRAIAAWNTRPPLPPVGGLREALEPFAAAYEEAVERYPEAGSAYAAEEARSHLTWADFQRAAQALSQATVREVEGG